ncbi:hypothetical protein [Pseudotabrizicola algicola]|uniref:Uncharacterized protein n=1 Tax=Pseudotabrizicola algicola TaxID=2709381 RepID=A0A6B3RIJ5_9RHOB|nr:hypothetical protein [Pseudotabrizicola algicola]NEX45857.1 hypothetical protein [Pseudotabrizicola algicola]
MVRATSLFFNQFVVSLVLCAGAAHAQTIPAKIDRDLENQIDFRVTDFGVCLEQHTCTVGGVTLSAFRQTASGEAAPATLYWDPIDGIGILGGGQNDEIDFDETLVVKFDRNVDVSGIWLSDLFEAEAQRYGARPTAGSDGEVAQVDLRRSGASQAQVIVNAEEELPARMFNTSVAPSVFSGRGDLLKRVVVSEESVVSLVSAEGTRNLGNMTGGTGLEDADKRELFAGLPTVEIDTGRLLSLIDGVVLLPAGEENAGRVANLVKGGTSLSNLYSAGKTFRASSDVSNGEVANYFETAISTDEIVFSAPFSTSNEFSVAGIMVLK